MTPVWRYSESHGQVTVSPSFNGIWPWRWKTIFSPEDIIEMKLEFDSLEKDRN